MVRMLDSVTSLDARSVGFNAVSTKKVSRSTYLRTSIAHKCSLAIPGFRSLWKLLPPPPPSRYCLSYTRRGMIDGTDPGRYMVDPAFPPAAAMAVVQPCVRAM
uniref:Uncharacterized protein n=1 Tax=Timema douglasi TaxID=61478 RepID=A0A7R8Z3R3_TIMDO|nr:unnamed protein product [Timema douglasi]